VPARPDGPPGDLLRFFRLFPVALVPPRGQGPERTLLTHDGKLTVVNDVKGLEE